MQSQSIPFSAAPRAVSAPFALAVIVPTFNEAANVDRIVASLDRALDGIDAEIIFVDDWSPDGTADRVEALARTRGDLRVIRRHGRRGLSSAVIEGMLATAAPIVAVIDGDGQHDERLLSRLHQLVAGGGADVAIGSRYCRDGSIGSWDRSRLRASRAATSLSKLVLNGPVDDPMSGFFAIRREIVIDLLPRLSTRGFKILFDLLTSSPTPLRAVELPYEFRAREAGESKLGTGVVLDYAVMIADRLVQRVLPPRMAMFAAVGTLGLGVHLAVLRAVLAAGTDFRIAQPIAVLVAIAFNFFFNNALTYREQQLRGVRALWGLLSFYLVCGLGALANIGVGDILFGAHERWWVSAIAGAAIGAAWNFFASAMLTWRRR